MSNVFTLDALNEEIERTYAPLTFVAGEQEFTLVSLMRVDAKVRQAVQDRLNTLSNTPDAEVTEKLTLDTLKFVLSSVTANRRGPALCKVLDDDVLRYNTLMKHWQEATQPGEASSSPN